MKKILSCLLLMILVTGMTACQDGRFGNAYIEGRDQQYMYTDLLFHSKNITETKEGYYFLVDSYLFFADKNTLEASPLCKKPGCLHEKETDLSQTWRCDAYYFSDYGRDFLTSYEEYLYIKVGRDQMGRDLPSGGLMKVSLDGTEKTLVNEFKREAEICALHRGTVYYASPAYHTKTANYTIRAVELGRPETQRILYEGHKEYGSIQNLLCYGDYLYFREDYKEGEESRIDIQSINLKTEEAKQLEPEGEGVPISLEGIFQDQIYYTRPDEHETGQYHWKHMNLDGSNPQDWTTAPIGQKLYADTEYFYLYTSWVFLESGQDPTLLMLDKEGNQLGNFSFDQIPGRVSDFIPGGKDYFFLISQEEDNSKHFYAVDKQEMARTGQGIPKELFQVGEIVNGYADLPL